jgi:sulfoxide reductase catalytic subunit YedY
MLISTRRHPHAVLQKRSITGIIEWQGMDSQSQAEVAQEMKIVSRRQFLHLAAVNTAGLLATGALAGCGSRQPDEGVATPQLQILRNENVPGFYVRYYQPFPAPDPGAWTLEVSGLVRQARTFSLEDLQSIPSVQQTRRMKCVECWSARATWEGFELPPLMELVDVLPQARWVHFYCADDYYESLSIKELLGEGVLFAYRMDGSLLHAKYGSPLRLVVPSKYGYKWPKAIVGLEFAEDEKTGYWPSVGPYTSSGVIVSGRDHPLDLPGDSRPIDGGEVIYPEDLQASQSSL